MKSGHSLGMTDTSGSLTRLGRTVRTLLKVRREAKRPLKNPGTAYRLEMRADSLSSNEEVSDLSTSTSRRVFP